MGLSGCLFLSNWMTLISGPQSGDELKRRIRKGYFKVETSRFYVAGETLKPGDFVYQGADGLYHKATTATVDQFVHGIAISSTPMHGSVEIMTSGEVTFRK